MAIFTCWQFLKASEGEVVYVHSNTCGYCSSFEPKFEKVISEFPELKVEKLDIHNDAQYERAAKLGAEVTPTVFLVKNGQIIDKIEGDIPENVFRDFLARNSYDETENE